MTKKIKTLIMVCQTVNIYKREMVYSWMFVTVYILYLYQKENYSKSHNHQKPQIFYYASNDPMSSNATASPRHKEEWTKTNAR